MPIEIQSAWIQAVGGGFFALIAAVCGIFIGRFIERRDRTRKRHFLVGHTVTPIVSQERIGPLSVSIQKSFLTKDDKDHESVPVLEAYVFFVRVVNIGLDDVEKPEINIEIDRSAAVAEIEATSNRISGDKISTMLLSGRKNLIRVIPNYMNKGDALSVSIFTINNQDTTCDVKVDGIGLNYTVESQQLTTSATTQTNTMLESSLRIVQLFILIVLVVAILIERLNINISIGR